MKRFLLFVLLTCLISISVHANIVFVKQSGGSDANDGTSWSSALASFDEAISKANSDNTITQIWVAEGIYIPANKAGNGTQERDRAFVLPANVKIYGGFTGDEHTIADRTPAIDDKGSNGLSVLSGVLDVDNAYHVVIAASNEAGKEFYLDGFTITGGKADGGSSSIKVNGINIYRSEGGGVNISGVINMQNNTIEENIATSNGGGLFGLNLSTCILSNNVISKNKTSSFGGGVYVENSNRFFLTGNVIEENTSSKVGGGMYASVNTSDTFILSENTITGNISSTSGGGICVSNSGVFVLTNNKIDTNKAALNGGGIYAFGFLQPILNASNNLINDNQAGNGGGIWLSNVITFTLTNNSILGNNSTNGGGLYIDSQNNSTKTGIVNNTLIWGNRKTGTQTEDNLFRNGVNGTLTINSCMVESMTDTELNDFGSGVGIDNMNGVGLTADDVFADYDAKNYRLHTGSIVVNRGNKDYLNQSQQSGADVDGLPRVVGSKIDIGAFEFLWGGLSLIDEQSLTYNAEVQSFSNKLQGLDVLTSKLGTLVSQTITPLTGKDVAQYTSTTVYEVTYNGTPKLYPDTVFGAKLNINKLAVTVVPDATTKVFGEVDPTLTYTVTPSLAGDDSFTGALTREAGDDVNSYIINQGTLALSNNYMLTYDNSENKFRITSKVITVTPDATTKVFTQADPTLTYTYAPELIGGDSFTGVIDREAGEDAATYLITQGILALNSNYSLIFDNVANKFTISPKEITITPHAQTKMYGEEDPTFTYTYAPSPESGDNFTGILSREVGNDAGTYLFELGSLALTTNYKLTVDNAVNKFTITKATPVIQWKDGQSNWTFDYDGTAKSVQAEIVNSFGAGSINYEYKLEGITTDPIEIGTYTVSALLPESQNFYASNQLTGTVIILNNDATLHGLTVNGVEATITGRDVYYALPCEDRTSTTVSLQVTLPMGAKLQGMTDNVFTMDIPLFGGLSTRSITVVSQSGTGQMTYNITVERYIDFATIVHTKWNNTLMLNLNKLTQEGIRPISYQWYHDDNKIDGATKATYSAGPKRSDVLDEVKPYQVALTLSDGTVLHTCREVFVPKRLTPLSVYPNPVLSNRQVTIELSEDNAYWEGTRVELYNTNGALMTAKMMAGSSEKLIMPDAKGTYIIRVTPKEGDIEEVKVIVK